MELLPAELLERMTPAEREVYLRALQIQVALSSPADYAETVDPDFLRPRHVELMSDVMVKLTSGTLLKPDGTPFRKLAVSMPPRHGKSEMLSKYVPAWYLTKYPNRRVVVASYEADFAASWGRKVRDLIEQGPPWLSPKIRSDSRAAARWELESGGAMFTAGVGGPLTGKGANLMGIDDPIKNAEEAQSEIIREKQWDWIRSTAFTRLEPQACLYTVMTRWHEDDVLGRFEQEEPGEWYIINFPAIATEHDVLGRAPGEALWPERYDEAALAAIKETVGSYYWAAMYQQTPMVEGGGIFRHETFGNWHQRGTDKDILRLSAPNGTQKVVSRDAIWTFTTVDLAASTKNTADWTVFALWGVTPDNELLLMDLWRQRIESADHYSLLEQRHAAWAPRFHGIEKVTYGLTLVQTASRVGRVPIRELKADKDKVSRAYGAAALAEAGKLYLPKSAPWLESYVHELLGFPNGTHDDQVDVTSYAAVVVSQRLTPPRANKTHEDMTNRVPFRRESKRHNVVHPTLGNF